jgi:hypothetical protein
MKSAASKFLTAFVSQSNGRRNATRLQHNSHHASHYTVISDIYYNLFDKAIVEMSDIPPPPDWFPIQGAPSPCSESQSGSRDSRRGPNRSSSLLLSEIAAEATTPVALPIETVKDMYLRTMEVRMETDNSCDRILHFLSKSDNNKTAVQAAQQLASHRRFSGTRWEEYKRLAAHAVSENTPPTSGFANPSSPPPSVLVIPPSTGWPVPRETASLPPRHGRRAANATLPIAPPIPQSAGTSGDAVEEPIHYKKLKHPSLLPLNTTPSDEAMRCAEQLEEQRVRELELESLRAEAHRLFFVDHRSDETSDLMEEMSKSAKEWRRVRKQHRASLASKNAAPNLAAQPSVEAEDEEEEEFIPGAGVKSFMLLLQKADREISFDPAVDNFLWRTKGPFGPETGPLGMSVR